MPANGNSYPEALAHSVFPQIAQAADALRVDAYVIGGFVRDYFLEREAKQDIDVVAIGSGIELAQEVAKVASLPKPTIFKRYGTAMVNLPDGELEFVGARKESYDQDSRNPVVEDGTLEDDQNRRDFTINAMALQLNEDRYATLVDPFNGIQDLADKIIRTPLDPDVTYSDDPLRMLRAIRFACQLDFMIEDESLMAIYRNADRINIISKERIVVELHKILECDRPSKGFHLLERTGLLKLIMPELTALKGIEEIEGQRHKDNFYHTLEVVDNISRTTGYLWLRWAALLHDIGKAPTKRFDKKIGWTFHGHEFQGSKMVYKLFKRLRMPLNDKMKYVQKLVRMSSRPIIVATDIATDSAVRRLVHDAGDDLEDLMTLCEADITTKSERRKKRYLRNFQVVREKVVEVEARDQVRNFQPPVSGEEIMSTLGLQPSREVGILKSYLKEAVLDGTIPNEHDAAFALMMEKAKEMGLA